MLINLKLKAMKTTKLKEYEVYKNGTQHATLKAKSLKDARLIVFSWYGEHREVYKA